MAKEQDRDLPGADHDDDDPEGIDETGLDAGGDDDLATIAADPHRLRVVPDELAEELGLSAGAATALDDEPLEGEVIDDDLADLPLAAARRVMAERDGARGREAGLAAQLRDETARRVESQKVSIASAEANLKGQRSAVIAELQAAEEEGDAKKKTEALSKLVTVDRQEADLARAKQANEAEAERLKQGGSGTENPDFVQFKQANRWFGADEGATAYADAVARQIVKKGVQPGTAEFFRQIRTETLKRFPEHASRADAGPRRPAGDQRTQRPMARGGVAAPARATGPARQRESQVALTPAEKAQMRTFGLDPADRAHQIAYANQIRAERGRARFQ